MKFKLTVAVCATMLVVAPGCSSSPERALDYLGQTPPGLTPVRFSYGTLASQDSKPRIPVFSRSGKLLVFNMGDPSQVYVSEKWDSGWTQPSLATFSLEGANWEPFLLPDDRTLLFVSTRPPGKAPYQGRIWRTWRLESGAWEPPTLVHSTVEPEGLWFPTARETSSMYFSGTLAGSIGDSDLWRADLTSEPPAITNLGAPLNSAGIEWDPYPSPDGRYLLFASNRAGGHGRVDLYAAFRNADSGWSQPVNLGPEINSARNEVAAVLSPDGKYLFFIREPDELYWVSSEVIESVRPK
jgi:hypothetical protein